VLLSLPEAPVKWDLLVQEHVVEASLWAVLCYYGNVWHLDAATDKLAQVGVIELSGQKRKRCLGVLRCWEDVFECLLPDLFYFLSDGFGQRKAFCLDPFDCDCPAVTANEKESLRRAKSIKLVWADR